MTYLILSLLLAAADVPPDSAMAKYHILVKGPLAEIDRTCNDPCQIDEHEIVGSYGGKITKTEEFKGKMKNPDHDSTRCKKDCDTDSTLESQVVFNPKRDLREGLEVTIEQGRAHFIFYSVVETENGPATRRQHSEFRIDRPVIDVELHGHDVVVTMVVEANQ